MPLVPAPLSLSLSKQAADELADDPRWRTGMNGVEEAGVDFRRFLSLIADLDERDVADLRRRVLAAAAAGHLPAALNGGTVAIEVRLFIAPNKRRYHTDVIDVPYPQPLSSLYHIIHMFSAHVAVLSRTWGQLHQPARPLKSTRFSSFPLF